jgi:hypothetical protein
MQPSLAPTDPLLATNPRPDSPLLGFDVSSGPDPLCFPSPDFTRSLPAVVHSSAHVPPDLKPLDLFDASHLEWVDSLLSDMDMHAEMHQFNNATGQHVFSLDGHDSHDTDSDHIHVAAVRDKVCSLTPLTFIVP